MSGMPASGTRYASFLLRVWRSNEAGAAQPGPGWQGEIEHLQTRQCWTFHTLDELLHSLREQLDELGPQ